MTGVISKADLVVDAVQHAGHDGEEGGLECFDVVHQEGNVALVEAHSSSVAEHGYLTQE